jgi:hypothetical protein
VYVLIEKKKNSERQTSAHFPTPPIMFLQFHAAAAHAPNLTSQLVSMMSLGIVQRNLIPSIWFEKYNKMDYILLLSDRVKNNTVESDDEFE